jgi:hypothetical protein
MAQLWTLSCLCLPGVPGAKLIIHGVPIRAVGARAVCGVRVRHVRSFVRVRCAGCGFRKIAAHFPHILGAYTTLIILCHFYFECR